MVLLRPPHFPHQQHLGELAIQQGHLKTGELVFSFFDAEPLQGKCLQRIARAKVGRKEFYEKTE
jgi:hypothetical protein